MTSLLWCLFPIFFLFWLSVYLTATAGEGLQCKTMTHMILKIYFQFKSYDNAKSASWGWGVGSTTARTVHPGFHTSPATVKPWLIEGLVARRLPSKFQRVPLEPHLKGIKPSPWKYHLLAVFVWFDFVWFGDILHQLIAPYRTLCAVFWLTTLSDGWAHFQNGGEQGICFLPHSGDGREIYKPCFLCCLEWAFLKGEYRGVRTPLFQIWLCPELILAQVMSTTWVCAFL